MTQWTTKTLHDGRQRHQARRDGLRQPTADAAKQAAEEAADKTWRPS